MAPLRAMILSLLDGAASETIHFWYGARSGRDVPYEEEMRTLAAQYSNFDWRVVLSESGEAGHGMVHEVVQRELLANIRICGIVTFTSAGRRRCLPLHAKCWQTSACARLRLMISRYKN